MKTSPLSGAVLVRTLKKISDNMLAPYSYKMDDMGRLLDHNGIMTIVTHSEVGGLYVEFTRNKGQTVEHIKDISISDLDTMAKEILDWVKLKGLVK